MKRPLIIIVLTILVLTAQALAQGDPALKDEKEKISYSVGVEIGTTLKKQGIEVTPDVLTRGIRDALTGAKTLMTEEEIIETLTDFRKEFIAKKQELAKQLAEKNKKEGEAFLAENEKKEGVKTLPSGLQYKVIKPGSGKKPKDEDTVTVHYRGTLIGGTEFDSSYRRGKPATFPANRVIPGWTEVLQLMEEGAKWEVFIPSKLAYGERGAGDEIGPNATLIFEIELISIQEKP
jgi:FKBP-type peptidyl-prolyl cis-trans isomerase FklB